MNWENFFRSELTPMQPYQPGLREEQIIEIAQTPFIHKLSSNENPNPPFPSALAAMADCLTGLNEYSDGSCYELKRVLAAQYQLPSEQIMIGNGANELLMLLAEACLTPDSRVAYCWPSFIVYRMAAQIMGVAYDEAPLTPDGAFDLEALLGVIKPQTKLVYLCSPNNPTGGIISQDVFAHFMEQVPEQVLVVLDLAYNEFVTDSCHVDPFSFYDGERPLVIIHTFSKIYGLAGARVGYGFAPEPVVQAVDKVREPFNINTVAQVGALASLGQDEELESRRAENSAQRQALCAGFDRLGLSYYDSHANFVWVFIPQAEQVFEKLLERGVIVRPFAGAAGLRVGVGNESDTLATLAAFEQILSSPQQG